MPSVGIPVAGAASCETSASSEATCSGCGHCQVSKPGERCGCCARKHQKPVQEATTEPKNAGCCHRSPINSQKNSAAQVEESPKAGSPKEDLSNESYGVCLCAGPSQPAVPTSSHRLATEQLVKLLLLDVTGFAESDSAPPRLAIGRLSIPPDFEPRDSQRRLCVWRI